MSALLIGAVTGLASGLFGIGGALLATPLLRLTGVEPLLALATPLPAVIPTALSGLVPYWNHGLLRWDLARWILLGGLPGTVGGAWATRWIGGQLLMVLSGLLLATIGMRFLWDVWREQTEEPTATEATAAQAPALSLLGLGAGLLSGLLAIGGGIVIVPALVYIFRLPLKQALATSLLCVAVLAVPSTVVHGILGHIRLELLLPFLLGSLPMAYLGGNLALQVSARSLRLLYGSAVVGFALYFVWTQLH